MFIRFIVQSRRRKTETSDGFKADLFRRSNKRQRESISSVSVILKWTQLENTFSLVWLILSPIFGAKWHMSARVNGWLWFVVEFRLENRMFIFVEDESKDHCRSTWAERRSVADWDSSLVQEWKKTFERSVRRSGWRNDRVHSRRLKADERLFIVVTFRMREQTSGGLFWIDDRHPMKEVESTGRRTLRLSFVFRVSIDVVLQMIALITRRSTATTELTVNHLLNVVRNILTGVGSRNLTREQVSFALVDSLGVSVRWIIVANETLVWGPKLFVRWEKLTSLCLLSSGLADVGHVQVWIEECRCRRFPSVELLAVGYRSLSTVEFVELIGHRTRIDSSINSFNFNVNRRDFWIDLWFFISVDLVMSIPSSMFELVVWLVDVIKTLLSNEIDVLRTGSVKRRFLRDWQ